jgi:hypothetical protein
MAFSGDPSNPPPKGHGGYAGGNLTPDDFEQLAAAFRPSWDRDVAALTGAGTLPAPDAIQGGGARADVRATPPLTNGTHAPVAAAVLPPEPMASVIVRPSSVPPPPVSARPPLIAGAGPSPGSVRPPEPAPRFMAPAIPAAPGVPTMPFARPVAPSFNFGESTFPGRSKKPLWIGLGVGATVIAAAVGIWAASGSEEKPATPASTAAAVTETKKAETPSIPPPPPEPVAATAEQHPPSSLAAPPGATAPWTAALPAPPPPPQPGRAAPAAAPPPARPPAASPAAPKPAAHKNTTIVRDVPF